MSSFTAYFSNSTGCHRMITSAIKYRRVDILPQSTMMRTAAASKSKGDQSSKQQVFPFGMYAKSITLTTGELVNYTHTNVCNKC